MRRPGIQWLVALACPLLAFTGPSLAQDERRADVAVAARRVVILNDGDPSLPAFIEIDRGLRSALAAPGEPPVDIFYEALDLLRFPESMVEDELVALMARKYAVIPVDAVISVGSNSLDFAERHHERLWPGARIVFQGVPTEELVGRRLSPLTTGTPLRHDFAGIARLARQLRPTTRRLVVVSGSGDLDHGLVQIAHAQLDPVALGMPVEYWVDQPLDDLRRRMRALGRDDAVLYLAIGRDAVGHVFVPRDVLAELAALSPAPIYGPFETFVGHGAVAGMVYPFEAGGRQTGDLVHRILDSPGRVVPALNAAQPSTCVADASRMEQMGLGVSRLPADCDVRFLPPSLWRDYRWQAMAAVAIMAAQLALITVLVLERRARVKAEKEVLHRRQELAQASRLALAGELTASIAHEINQPLGAILANAGAADSLLRREPGSGEEVRVILGDIQKADIRASEIIRRVKALVTTREAEHECVDLNALINETIAFLEGDARRRGVAVETFLAPGLPPVYADRVQLQQALVNLCVNAMEAMSATIPGGRRLGVRTQAGTRGAVLVVVTDSGPGIPHDHVPHLFDAFFTTKKQGTGLGLSITRSIVEAHHGRITAENREEGGAVFRITLPPMR